MGYILRKITNKILDLFPVIERSISGVARKKLELFPRIIQVETTAACNAECIMCPQRNITRQKGHLDFELYKKIVDDCAQSKRYVKTFFPFLNGETFLLPNWPEYLVYARRKLPRVEIGIFTNGSLLNAGNIDRLLSIGLDWINISFDGVSRQVYEQIRRKLDFEEVKGNILQLVNKRAASRKKNPRITISIIKMDQTISGLKPFLKEWNPVVDEVTVEPYSNWAGKIEDKMDKGRQADRRRPCSRLWHNFTVLNTGEVVICCLDYDGEIIVGDTKRQTIQEIWRGPKLSELRKLHLQGKYSQIPLCKDCNYGKYQTDAWVWWV